MTAAELAAVRNLYAIIRRHEMSTKRLEIDRVFWGHRYSLLLAAISGEPLTAPISDVPHPVYVSEDRGLEANPGHRAASRPWVEKER